MSIDYSQPRTVKAWVVPEAGKPFELSDVELPPLQADDVEVKITHCGMCLSDLDAADGKYGPAMKFPGVCGHEGIGVITHIGSAVINTRIGARVGIGCYRGSCGCCIYCSNGKINLCSQRKLTFLEGPMSKAGGFSSFVRTKAVFAIPIPDNIESADAGPLMCAGTTVFAPFRNHSILSGESVGVVGIGGLGALAIQLGRAHGCEMVAMSSSATKKDMCLKDLRAHRYIDMSNADEMKQNTGRLNYILVTAPASSLDWAGLLNQLANDGKIVILGAIREPIPVSGLQLLMGQKTICGSAAGSVGLTIDMLRLASIHGIKPMIEKFPFTQINEAAKRLKANQIRFRAVLEHQHE